MATKLFNYSDKHVVAESSLLNATYQGGGRIVSMEIAQDIDNGKALTKGAFLRPEVYQGVAPKATDEIYLVLNPPVIAEDATSMMQNAEFFYNASGDILRCYPLVKTDVFTLSEMGIKKNGSNALKVGDAVIASGVDFAVPASAPAETVGFVGKIIEIVEKSNGKHYRVEVVRNSATA